jgi:hypothetical protein
MPHRITLSLTTKQAGTPGRNWLTFISRMGRADDQQPSCSAKMRRKRLQPISPSCRSSAAISQDAFNETPWCLFDAPLDSGRYATEQANRLTVLIGPRAHTIPDKDLSGSIKAGVTVSKDGARYQPVAWWFTKRRLGRELRNLYQAIEEKLPPQLLALVRKLEGEPDTSLEAKGEGCGSSPPQ